MRRFKKIIVWLLFVILNLNYSAAFAGTITPLADPLGAMYAVEGKMAEETAALKGSSEEADFLIQLNTDLRLDAPAQADQPGLHAMDKKTRNSIVVSALKKDAAEKQRPIIEQLKKDRIPYESFFVVNMLKVKMTYDQAEKLSRDSAVRKVYLDEWIQVIDPKEMEPDQEVLAESALWNIEQVSANLAWSMGYRGEGVVVGIIDTGADWSHPAITRQFRAYNELNPSVPDATELSASWYDPVTGSSTPVDDNSHGTHCIGTMVGQIPGGTTIGVAPEATWIAAKALNAEGSASNSSLLMSGQWMMAPGGDPSKAPDVINNSWGGNDITSEWFRDMVRSWRSAGIVPVFAAGNQIPGEPAPWDGSIVGPAYYPESFAVAAVDSANNLASFSKLGPSTMDPTIAKPEISAPGVSIYSSLPGGGYGYSSGTSMAAPHVAGVVALMLSANAGLSVDDVLLTIQRSATPLTNYKFTSSPNMGFGYGLINAKQAIDASIHGLPRSSYSITVVDSQFSPIPGARVTLLEKPAQAARFTGEDGTVRYEDLQVGRYTVNVYHPRYGNVRQQIVVVEGMDAGVYVPLSYKGTASGSLQYDDGWAEQATVYNGAGVGYGVAVRPERYGLVKSVSAYFRGTDFPSPGGTRLRLAVYEADENMLPTSKLLIAPFEVAVTRGALNTFDVSGYGLKTDRPFIPVLIQVDIGSNSPAIGLDLSSPSGNKHSYVLSGGTFIPRANLGQTGAFMIRAAMEYAMEEPKVSLDDIDPSVLYHDRRYTSEETVELSGTAAAAENVTITNQGSDAGNFPVIQGQFRGMVTLSEGVNRLKASASYRDLTLAYSDDLEVILDQTEPVLHVSVPSEVLHTKNYVLNGTVEEANLKSLTLNGSQIPVDPDGRFSHQLYLDTGLNQFSLKAEDVVGFTAEQIIQLTSDLVLDAIEITKFPDQRTYFLGEALDITGLEITGLYSDGSREVIPVTSDQITGFNSSSAQMGQVLTVTVEDQSASFTVDILARALDSIAITRLPDKRSYIQGQPLDLTGLEITGSYNDGTTEILPVALADITGFDSSQPAAGQVITVTVAGKTTTFTVDILARALDSIAITRLPDKRSYIQGQMLDLNGLEVTGSYNDGTTEILPVALAHITGFDSSQPAAGQVITVTVAGKTTTFTVDILARVLASIEITTLPDKLIYFIGQPLDLTGLEVTGTYNDGTTQILPVTLADITGFDSSQPAAGQVITVTVAGETTTFTVDILARALESIEITTLPDKLIYFIGQPLDLTGLEVTGTYNDGTTQILPVTLADITGFDSSQPATSQKLTVTVGDKTADFHIDVFAIVLESIEITKQPAKLTYIQGQTLDLAGLEVTGTYNDRTSKVLPVTLANITGFDSSQPAAGQVVTVTVEGKKATFTVEIIQRVMTAVEVLSYPAKTDYYIGEALDLSGVQMKATWNDGTSSDVPQDQIIATGFDSVSPQAAQTITLRVGAHAFTYQIVIRYKPVVKTFAGTNRYHTANLISQALYERSETAVLVSGTNFPDALAAGPLAHALQAPILLTDPKELSEETRLELGRLGVKKVVILGGDLAVSEAVETALTEQLEVTVLRIAGATRYQTAVKTAEYLKTLKGAPTQVMLTSGTSFADALSTGGYAASAGFPILITDGKTLSADALTYLNANAIQKIQIAGGNVVVSAELEAQLISRGFTVTRISGATRVQTSAAVANQYYATSEFVIAANGWTFADALAAAPLAARLNASVLLVARDAVDTSISTYLNNAPIHTIHVAGGDLVVSPAVRGALLNAVQ